MNGTRINLVNFTPYFCTDFRGPRPQCHHKISISITATNYDIFYLCYQSQNAKRASSQKRHMVISIFLLCNSLILMSIGAGSIRAIKGGLDKVFKIRDRLHRICRQILR